MAFVCKSRLVAGACLEASSLLRSRVLLVRLACAAALCFTVIGKDIRLRNELIRTPDFSTAAVASSSANDAPVDGLFIIQFKKPITDDQRGELLRNNVELVQHVPEDAYVARLSSGRLAAIRKLSYVHWIGPFRPEHKIHQRLVGVNEKRAVSFLLAPNARGGEVAILRKHIPGSIAAQKTSAGTVVRGVVDANQL